jgi:NADH:ubiquinone oxidoreductase subunit 2 (subunit N)
LTSVIALGYYLRVIITMWMKPRPESWAIPSMNRPLAAFLAGFCAAMVLALGLIPGFVLGPLF